ncbi:MAG: NHL repeat-containing protein [Solirubrobacterales bacterium]
MLRSVLVRSLLLASTLLALAAPSAGAFGQIGVVNPVGGGPDDGNFQLDGPNSLLRAPDGTFFVLDSGNSRVVRLSSGGQFLYAFGGPIGTDAGTRIPISATLYSSSGQTYVIVSTLLDGIKMFTASGTFVAKFGTSIQGAYLATDPSCGELYASEPQGRQVQRFAIQDNPLTAGTTEHFGDLLETFGGGATSYGQEGKLWSPRGIDVDSTGRVFVADAANSRVSTYKWSGNCGGRTHAYEKYLGNNLSGSPSQMLAPTGVTIDRSITPNRIYVTQTYLDNVVQVFTGDSLGEPHSGLPYYDLVARWGTTVPYGSVPGAGADDLNYPSSIAISGDDGWVAENGNNRIHGYTGVQSATTGSAPVTTTLWGRDPNADGFFRNAATMATAPDGSVWVVDTMKYRVQHFSPRGQLLGAFGEYGTDPGQFVSNPTGVAVRPDGELLVASGLEGLQRFSSSGDYLGLFTWPPESPATSITAGPVAVDAAGEVFVWDWSAQRMRKLAPDGSQLASFGSSGSGANDTTLSGPASIAVSPDGLTVFVLDRNYNRVKKFTSGDGTSYIFSAVSSQTGTSGSEDGRLSNPSELTLSPDGATITVADTGNNRIEQFNASDLSYAGKFGAYGFADDQLISPGGAKYDRWGNLWVSDSGNDRLKRFGEAPVVTISTAATTTEASSIALIFETTDPAAECDRTSGTSAALSPGANTLSVTCTNAEGSGSASVVITRIQASTPRPPVLGDPTFKLAKKIKLSKSNAFTLPVTCPAGCKVSGKVKIGKKSSATKSAALAGQDAAQSAKLAVSKPLAKKIRAALKKRQSVTLTVTVQAYTAKQGKTGKAKVSR